MRRSRFKLRKGGWGKAGRGARKYKSGHDAPDFWPLGTQA